MRVAIRTDASAAIGLGHLQRCLALAHALRKAGAEVVFVTRALGTDSRERVAAAGFVVHVLPPPSAAPGRDGAGPAHAAWSGVPWAQDAEETARAPGTFDRLVVDHYAFDARWHRAVATGTGARLAVIDDLADRPLSCDVLIDHNYAMDHRAKYRPWLDAGTPILGGPEFALLGPSYEAAPRHRCRRELKSIGVFMGGADAGGYTAVAWKACRDQAGFTGSMEIVVTQNNPRLEQLRELARRDAAATLVVGLPELSGFFARHDLQIGAGGGATWERCCIGAPAIAMAVADNQKVVLEPLRDLGVLRAVEPEPRAIGREVQALMGDPDARCAMAQRAARLVDGHGAARVAQHLASA